MIIRPLRCCMFLFLFYDLIVGGQKSMRLGLGNSDVDAGTEEKVTGEGGWISLGPWGPEGWSRRSRCEASYKADGPVMEITVHCSHSPVSDTESIDAISFQSKSRDVVIGCSEIGSSCCQRKEIEEKRKSKIKELEDKVDELVMKMKEADAKNEVMRKKNEEMVKAVDDLQKIEEEFKIEIKELKKEMEGVAAENEGPKQRSEVMEVLIKQRNEIMSNIIVDEGGAIRGPWGGHGGSFWAYKTNVTPIMEITLRYGEIIDSVLFTNYGRLNGDVVGCSNRIGGTGGPNHETISIDSSEEQLMSISLTTYQYQKVVYISSLCFHSNRNSYGPYGTVRGPDVSIPIEEGEVLAGFHGRSGLYLDAIGIIVARKVLNS